MVTSGGQAELSGRALGGYVNVVTKSSSNVLHADVFGYFTPTAASTQPRSQYGFATHTGTQYSASLSRPIRHDKTFYFANFEAAI